MTARIPVTLISGYLGAGKTTLINQLLAGDHGRRIAVLVNDFGAINIDAALIKDRDEQAISLANGCVCCSITDDLGTALDMQAAREIPPEIIVLEASGVAQPARIACHAGNWPGFELDAILTIVDVEMIQTRAQDKFVGQLVKNQIKAADFVILTKTDLCPKWKIEAVTAWIRELAPDVQFLDAASGPPDPRLLFGVAARDLKSSPEEILLKDACVHKGYWYPPKPLDRTALAACLDRLPDSIHRVKGFFIDAKTDQLTLLQRVGRRLAFEVVSEDIDVGLVMIAAGPQDDIDLSQKILSSCCGKVGEVQTGRIFP